MSDEINEEEISVNAVVEDLKKTTDSKDKEQFVAFALLVDDDEYDSTSEENVDDAIDEMCGRFSKVYNFERGEHIKIIKTIVVKELVVR